ncbi:MAG: hypothetical protein A3F17_07060 [Gammaproteobacteria bacterium RIFCSPHIGHO2_12_FULL_41_15]|nr:MAG: hypothetical protein A3F17_07060 [Gammaproteobacteria bacterium RIFCSPHIGHO2_12_FULL_41_15]
MTDLPMNRLRWICRRGMLELDVILEKFLQNGYENLSESQKLIFYQLLELPDPVLYHWLIASQDPDEADWLEVIALIRAA